MALQQTLLPATVKPIWFKQPVAVMLGVCVAGLIAVATLYTSFAGSKSTVAQKSALLHKQQPASSGGGICTEQKKQSTTGSSTFSLVPGRLNRLLQ